MSALPKWARIRSWLVEVLFRLCLPVCGAGLLAAGVVGVVTFALVPLNHWNQARAYVPVAAIVEHVQVMPLRRRLPLPLDYVELRYRYEIDGQTYRASRYGPHGGLVGRTELANFTEAVHEFPSVRIWVHPLRAERAMVARGLHWPVVGLAIPALVMCFLGAIMVLVSMLIWNHPKALTLKHGWSLLTKTD